jgi:hypothetical protein
MKKEYLTEIPDLGDISKYAMTEIPKDLRGFSKIETDEVYDKEFWDKVAETIRKENKQYEEQCKRMQIDPVSGKSTMSWEDRNRMFNL